MWILEGCVSEYRVIYPDNDIIIDKKTIKDIEKTVRENDVKLLLTDIKECSLVSKEVKYQGNSEVIEDVRSQLGLYKLKLNSFIFTDVNIKLQLLDNENYNPDNYNISLSGNTQDIGNVIKKIEEITGVGYTLSAGVSQNLILIIPWLVNLSIVIFFNIFIFSLTKKETLLNIVFGCSPAELFFRRFLNDAIIFFLEFLIAFFLIQWSSGLRPQADFLIAMFLLMCTVDAIFNLQYFSLHTKRSRRILGNYINTAPLVSQTYIIRFIITTLSVIIISYAAATVIPLIKYFKAENVIRKYQDYSFSRIVYHHNENENILDILKNENMSVEYIYRTYFNNCDILTLTCYDEIVYSNVNTYSYIADTFNEIETSDLQKDLYFLVPDNLSETEKSEVIEIIRNDVANIEGDDFDYTYEVIEYKSGKDIMVFNYEDTGCGFDFVRNPYLVYNTIDYSTLTTDYSGTDRISVAYSSLYHMNEETLNEINKIYPQIDIKQTNIIELYRRYYYQTRVTMIFQVTVSVYLLILLFVIINILVKSFYEVNAKEFALKKVFGYSYPERFRRVLIFTVISDCMSAAVSRKLIDIFYINRFGSSIDESFFPYKILWSISALVIVVNFGTLILRIVKFDRENITKILKGGAL